MSVNAFNIYNYTNYKRRKKAYFVIFCKVQHSYQEWELQLNMSEIEHLRNWTNSTFDFIKMLRNSNALDLSFTQMDHDIRCVS